MRKQLAIEWWIFVGGIAALMVYGAAPWWVVCGWLVAQTPIVIMWQVAWWQRRDSHPAISVYRPSSNVRAPVARELPAPRS